MPDWDILNLDSFPTNVRSVKIVNQQFSVNEDSEEPDTTFTPRNVKLMRFDRDGRKISERYWLEDEVTYDTIWYSKDGLIRYEKTKSSFDITLTTTIFNMNGTIISEMYDATYHGDVFTQYEYNEVNAPIRKTVTYSEYKTVEEITYDVNGQPMIVTYNSSETTEPLMTKRWEKVLRYNDAGLCDTAIKTVFRSNGEIFQDTTWFNYDTLGKIRSQKDSKYDGKQTTVFIYDAQNRITSVFHNQYDNTRYRFDDHGNWRSVSITSNSFSNSEDEEWSTTYNDKGLPIRCVHRHGEETTIYTWKYQYWK